MEQSATTRFNRTYLVNRNRQTLGEFADLDFARAYADEHGGKVRRLDSVLVLDIAENVWVEDYRIISEYKDAYAQWEPSASRRVVGEGPWRVVGAWQGYNPVTLKP